MTDEQKYLFDLQGFIVLKGVIPQIIIDSCNEGLRSIRKHATRGLSTAAVSGNAANRAGTLYLQYFGSGRHLQRTHRHSGGPGCRSRRNGWSLSTQSHLYDLPMGWRLYWTAHARHTNYPKMPVPLSKWGDGPPH